MAREEDEIHFEGCVNTSPREAWSNDDKAAQEKPLGFCVYIDEDQEKSSQESKDRIRRGVRKPER